MEVVTILAAILALAAQSDPDFFEKRVRPILVDRCVKCHSGAKPKGGLRLDVAGRSRAIVPGDPDRSLLVQAVRRENPDLQMPPDEKLTASQVADLTAWVKMGAPDPRGSVQVRSAGPLWSLQPLRVSPQTSVDEFIQAKLAEKGLTPGGPADKRALIRRATFDLIGLPATPEEIDAFVGDSSPKAFERVVERLLASPHYGERWGRHWLDAARYADSSGNATDFPVPQAYRYRNYVINAFNRDVPYDRFLREQIAGDLMPSASDPEKVERIVATGFIALSRRPGLYPEREPHLTIEDTLETIGRSVLGLSVGCARCHDHKFDPISNEDYYALYGIFQSTRYPFPGSEDAEGSAYQRDLVPLIPASEAEALLAPWRARLAAVEAELERLRAQRVGSGEVHKRRNQIVAQRPVLEEAFALAEGVPANARIQKRGEPMALGAEVPRRFLSALGGERLPDGEAGSGRRQLAEWLVVTARPLVARVIVNRIWQHHFGRGIVRTSDDFGSRGSGPTHPELLDFLAARFIENGWSIKEMHRTLMLSRTYQRSALGSDPSDPDDDFLGRARRRRLDAESLRDAILAVSGDLDRSMGGSHPIPPDKEWHKISSSAPFELSYETRRRSVYLFQGRLKKNAYLTLFDGANPNGPTGLRTISTTPLQALYLMNDRFVAQQSERMAERLLSDRASDPERVRFAFELALGRLPNREEQTAAESHVLLVREKLKSTDVPAEEHVRKSWAAFAQVLFASNEFAFVD
jgi:uncharacterized protein DUF1553/uncharacterized protein DUF1549/cytochrome c